MVVSIWYLLHFTHYGWLFADPSGNFATLAEFTTVPEYFRQLGIAAWRCLDFGQIALWLPLLWVVVSVFRNKVEEAQHRGVLALLTLVPLVTFAFFFAAFRNPIGHRYMLIPVLMGALWLCYEWAEGFRYDAFRARVWAVLLFFWTGHLWVALYPSAIAKGWDATLLHLQAGAAKCDMKASLEALPPTHRASIGAYFPDADPWGVAFLDSSKIVPAPLDFGQQTYWLFSSASNDFDPAAVAPMKAKSTLRIRCTYWPITLELWQAPALYTTSTSKPVL
jgi:hypothetical protein